ncbi:MAG TPA: cytochrome c [Puia sp.]
MRPYFLILLAMLSLAACALSPEVSPLSKFIGPDKLPGQIVTIDVDRDTVITTARGAILKIPAGALDMGGAQKVQLEIREAYTIEDIVRGGLLTVSKGRLLTSGGMIDIRPAGDASARAQVTMKKPITVSIPASPWRDNMQVYKGMEDGKGGIDWVDPRSMIEDTTTNQELAYGKKLFLTNCASCHGLGNSLTGPGLAFLPERRDKNWLAGFTRNNQRMILTDAYSRCLFDHWNKTPMSVFPELTDKDLDQLYAYIENESKTMDSNSVEDYKRSFDSCAAYYHALDSLRGYLDSLHSKRQLLINDNGKQVRENWVDGNGRRQSGSHPLNVANTPVVVEDRQALYYSFTINTFGWSNVDLLVSESKGILNSELRVTIKGAYRKDANILLVIPAMKIFQRGGLLKDKGDEYGFLTDDGMIPLPQGEEGYILVMVDYKGQVVFGRLQWTISRRQRLIIEPGVTTKEEMNTAVANLPFGKFQVMAADSKNATQIRETDKALAKIDSLKPANCSCDCGIRADSVR